MATNGSRKDTAVARKTRKQPDKPETKQISVFLPVNVAEALMAWADEKRWSTSSAAAYLVETGLMSAKAAG